MFIYFKKMCLYGGGRNVLAEVSEVGAIGAVSMWESGGDARRVRDEVQRR